VNNTVTYLELLAPARDAHHGIAAINHGADAVYIGAPKFGARVAVSNTLADIQSLINYGHLYKAKVYATLNTILYENEVDEAVKIIEELYNSGIDGIIIQDMAMLQLDLPPVPIIASTQTHNADVEKLKFFESLGFKRVILARELSLQQIQEIRSKTSIELEFFVHGALCVSYSGQCYLSEAICGRSGNRGVCAQPCRSGYDLIDKNGDTLIRNKHLLSLKDLNLSAYLKDLINAGISSFKIEGRLKDISYVKNITSFYRQKIDDIMNGNSDYRKTSSGKTYHLFSPDPDKSFNRGFTNFFINGRKEKTGSPFTQKSLGKKVGTVTSIGKGWITTDFEAFSNNDGICYFDSKNELHGTSVQQADGEKIYLKEIGELSVGTEIYRNHDQKFEKLLAGNTASRKIGVTLTLTDTHDGFHLEITDEDGYQSGIEITTKKEIAQNTENAKKSLVTQLSKLGDTIFEAREVVVSTEEMYFLPMGVINEMRRNVTELLVKMRAQSYTPEQIIRPKDVKYAVPANLSYLYNVSNRHARDFYTRLGAENIEPAFELQKNSDNKLVMTTKHCIKYQFDACPRYQKNKNPWIEPLYLKDNQHTYKLEFACKECVMKAYFEKQT
jgi:23S rRNA 5-hydroxycytidine C2501 synthase